MNKIDISAEEVPLPAWTDDAKSFIEKTLQLLNHNNWDLSVLFCSNSFIQVLNARYRGFDMPTDVLSFSLGEWNCSENEKRFLAGDIVISLQTLAENAREFNVGEDEELRRLLVHGILHLDGRVHDVHELNEAALQNEPMLVLQESILVQLKNERILCP
ncbi:MAG: rRNA maturation RNase YbeY [Spirochaetaceae bacterium]|jgi:probable rRNA maturation factor|nr:rRNA maturation RNase YbeY [Spirochaetaceae bacterium]